MNFSTETAVAALLQISEIQKSCAEELAPNVEKENLASLDEEWDTNHPIFYNFLPVEGLQILKEHKLFTKWIWKFIREIWR